jgi:hypothetical protein
MQSTPTSLIEKAHSIVTLLGQLDAELWQCTSFTSEELAKLTEVYNNITEYTASLKWSISVQLPKN